MVEENFFFLLLFNTFMRVRQFVKVLSLGRKKSKFNWFKMVNFYKKKLHRLPSVTIGYHRLQSVTINSSVHRLPSVTISYHRLPSVTICYHQLSSVTIGYHRLPSVTIGYHRLPSVTIGYNQLSSVHRFIGYHLTIFTKINHF